MTTKITQKRLRKLLEKARCAYLYASGDLLLVREEKFQGKSLDFRDVIRGYVPEVVFQDYRGPGSECWRSTVLSPGQGRVVITNRAFAALALERPQRVAVSYNDASESSRAAGVDCATLKVEYSGGLRVALEYLHRAGQPEETYLISADVTIQPTALGIEGPIDTEYTLDRPSADAPACADAQQKVG